MGTGLQQIQGLDGNAMTLTDNLMILWFLVGINHYWFYIDKVIDYYNEFGILNYKFMRSSTLRVAVWAYWSAAYITLWPIPMGVNLHDFIKEEFRDDDE